MANVNWDKVTTLYELVKDGVVGRTEMKDGIRVARVQAGQRSVIRIDIQLDDEPDSMLESEA